jgi:hypothetical protein
MFVPPERAQAFWIDVVKPIVVRPELEKIVTYFENTWIGSANRASLFPIQWWTQRLRVLEDRTRHGNHLESNNRKLQLLIKSNPGVWDFLSAIRCAYKGDFSLLHNVS